MFKKLSKSILTLALLVLSGVALAGDGVANESQPITYLIKFVVSGTPTATPGQFLVNADGYAPIVTNTGNVLDNAVPGLKIAKLQGALIQMLDTMDKPIVKFTCLPGSCQITLNDGTVLQSDTTDINPDGSPMVPLQGRMAMLYGTMDNSDGHIPVRIFGCGGIEGVAGPMNGWKGSICFNGEFNIEDFFNGSTSPTLTGGSNCTITMHDPKPFLFQ